MDSETLYSDDPVEVARRWEAAGAEIIHLVDLDGAVEGSAKNFGVIKDIIGAIRVPVQIGGGIRDILTAGSYLGMDRVKRIIIGTVAYENPALLKELVRLYPGRIAVGIDAKDGNVAIKGWETVTDLKAVTLAKRLEGEGIACIIFTDISRDGTLSGPNVQATKEIAESVKIPVIASGGISSIKDIESYKGTGIQGIIVGKALYAGNIDLKEAISAAS
jgi:phosphoribosylformimino-5-aminoimidazole carboxamide ribotide isomerase